MPLKSLLGTAILWHAKQQHSAKPSRATVYYDLPFTMAIWRGITAPGSQGTWGKKMENGLPVLGDSGDGKRSTADMSESRGKVHLMSWKLDKGNNLFSCLLQGSASEWTTHSEKKPIRNCRISTYLKRKIKKHIRANIWWTSRSWAKRGSY